LGQRCPAQASERKPGKAVLTKLMRGSKKEGGGRYWPSWGREEAFLEKVGRIRRGNKRGGSCLSGKPTNEESGK